jgi:hypothetical protein
MVFSNTHEGRAFLNTPEVLAGNNSLCPSSRGVKDKHDKKAQALMPSKRAKVELKACLKTSSLARDLG